MPAIGQWSIRRTQWADLARALFGQPLPNAGTLILYDDGLWALTDSHGVTMLRMVHAWRAWAWMTLRFERVPDPAPGSSQLTIWKAGVSEAAWHQLCLAVAGQLAMPGRGPIKEAS